MTQVFTERFPVPWQGLDCGQPDRIPDTKAPVVENFLTGIPNKLPVRGGLAPAFLAYAAGALRGRPHAWVFNNKTLWSFATQTRTSSYTGRNPNRPPGGIPHLSSRHFDPGSGVQTDVTSANEDTVPGPRFARLGSYIYGQAQQGVTPDVRKLLRWDGSATVPTAYATTVAPSSGVDIKAYLSRLFVLGGAPAGSTTVEPNSLYWSDPGGAPTGVVTEWQDDVSGLVNKIVIGADDQNDIGVGLAALPNALVIFKQRSIYLLTGSTPSTFSVRRIISGVGCIDNNSIIEYGDRVYFAAQDGIYAFDGVQLVKISDPIAPLLTDNTWFTYNQWSGGSINTAIKGQDLDGGYLLWTIVSYNGSELTVDKTFVYHAATNSWSRWTMTAGELLPPNSGTAAWAWPIRIGSGDVITHAYVNGVVLAGAWSTPQNTLLSLRPCTQPTVNSDVPVLYDRMTSTIGADRNSVIPFALRTKPRQLAPVERQIQLQKIILDYLAIGSFAGAIKLQLLDTALPIRNQLLPSPLATSMFTGGGLPLTLAGRFREVWDSFIEAQEVALSFSGPASESDAGVRYYQVEIHDGYLVFQVTQPRRSGP